MATPKLVPRAKGEGSLGTSSLGWGGLYITDKTTTSANQGGVLQLAADDGAAMGDSHRLGVVYFKGAEDTSSTLTTGARIEALTEAAWTNAENGAALYFYTTDGNASESNILKLDSSKRASFPQGKVGIGTTVPATGSTLGAEILNSTASAAGEGGALRLTCNDGAVMADNHRLGVVEFAGAEDTSNTISIGARIQAICRSAWDGSNNDADLEFYTTDGTTQSLVLTLDADKKATFAGAIQGNGNVTFGVDDTGIDFRVFSATASEGLLYDASEDELGLLLTTKLKFHDIGGGEEIFASANGHLEINSGTTLDATAPTVDINASTAITLNTPKLTGIVREVIALNNSGGAVDRTLTAAESGALITIDPSTDNTNTIKITLPTNATGLNYKFVVTADAANTGADILFTSASASNDFRGHILATDGGVEVVSNACAFTLDMSVFANVAATNWEVIADGTFWAITGFYVGNKAAIGTSGDGLLLTNSTL